MGKKSIRIGPRLPRFCWSWIDWYWTVEPWYGLSHMFFFNSVGNLLCWWFHWRSADSSIIRWYPWTMDGWFFYFSVSDYVTKSLRNLRWTWDFYSRTSIIAYFWIQKYLQKSPKFSKISVLLKMSVIICMSVKNLPKNLKSEEKENAGRQKSKRPH